MPSPIPIYLTGKSNSLARLNNAPPFAVPSNLVTMSDEISISLINISVCFSVFCPEVPSSTNITSCGAESSCLVMTRLIFFS